MADQPLGSVVGVEEAVDLALQGVDVDAISWEAEPAEDWPDWPMAGSIIAESGIPYGGATAPARSRAGVHRAPRILEGHAVRRGPTRLPCRVGR